MSGAGAAERGFGSESGHGCAMGGGCSLPLSPRQPPARPLRAGSDRRRGWPCGCWRGPTAATTSSTRVDVATSSTRVRDDVEYSPSHSRLGPAMRVQVMRACVRAFTGIHNTMYAYCRW